MISSLITGLLVPALLCGLYLVLILTHWGGHKGGFNSLSDVMLLFTDRWLVLAGWVHYLAFDLFIGSWQVRDARRNHVPFLLVAPVLGADFSLWAYWAVAVFVSGGDCIARQSVAWSSGGGDVGAYAFLEPFPDRGPVPVTEDWMPHILACPGRNWDRSGEICGTFQPAVILRSLTAR